MANYPSVVVLTGVGISQESGLQTFRGSNGLWEGYRVEEVASPEAFAKDPDLVHKFYNMRRRQLLSPDVKPNTAHTALAEFEKAYPGRFLLITQNVDNLHERGGSKNILHMHGELLKVRCLDTGEVFDWHDDLTTEAVHPKKDGVCGRLRPHIVWFGETPFFMDEIGNALAQCGVFIAIGTSGVVYPAASFVGWTSSSCHRVEINLKPSNGSSWFKEKITGPATTTVPAFFNNLLRDLAR